MNPYDTWLQQPHIEQDRRLINASAQERELWELYKDSNELVSAFPGDPLVVLEEFCNAMRLAENGHFDDVQAMDRLRNIYHDMKVSAVEFNKGVE